MSLITVVAAGRGFAMTADSLAMPELPVPDFTEWEEYPDAGFPERTVTENYGEKLMEDHAEKLFPLEDHSAIAASGILSVNDKGLGDLAAEFRDLWTRRFFRDRAGPNMVQAFGQYLNREIRVHLKHHYHLNGNMLLLAWYDQATAGTGIWKIRIQEAFYRHPMPEEQNFLLVKQMPERVVWGGHGLMCRGIQRAFRRSPAQVLPGMVNTIIRRLRGKGPGMTEQFMQLLSADPFYRYLFDGELRQVNMNCLSLQQAIDLSALMMRLEMDYFRLKKARPRVGGVIHSAVVDESGFNYLQ